MIEKVIFVLLVVSIVAFAIVLTVRNINALRKEKAGLKNESTLYKALVDKFTCDKKKNGYLEKYYYEYQEIIAKAKDIEVEHAICDINGSLEIVGVEGIIATLFPIVLEILMQVYIELAKHAYPDWNGGKAEIFIGLGGAALVFLIWGSFLSRLTSINRQKFFLELMQFELNRREKGEGRKMEQVENENKQLNNEYQQLVEQNSKMLRVRRKTEAEEIEIEVPVDKDTDSARLLKEIRKILD